MLRFSSTAHILLPALWGLFLVACQSPSEPSADQRRQVEEGLRPAVMVQGESLPTMPLADRMARWNVPGVSIAVIENGELVWAQGYGVTRAGQADSVAAQTRFQAASISKPAAAFAALRLMEDGVLALDAPVNRQLTSWTVPQNEYTRDSSVTLRGLLSHTAGMTVSGFPGYAADEPVPSLVQVLDGASPANTAPIRVDTVPGRTMRYAGGGYTVAQRLMIDATGEAFAPLMDRLVLGPLGMERSTFRQPLPDSLTSRAAAAHTDSGAVVTGRWHTYPEKAAAGLWTTAPDLARFTIELHRAYQGNSDLLSRETARLMMTPVQNGYGLGLTINGDEDSLRVSHTGGNRGYRCEMIMHPATGDGAVVLTNGFGGGVLTREIMRAIAATYEWPGSRWAPKEKPSIRLIPEVLRRYVGTYRNDSGQRVVVRYADDRLVASLPIIGNDLRLVPRLEARFYATAIDAELQFEEGASGPASSVTIYLGGDREWLSATRTP
ncbi:serine hydrolase [Longibacter sp.]|uniref:serine hydrolase n=1 Tax=Longibacter sp. TaxID=2045415 RepID=UPI003EB9B49C